MHGEIIYNRTESAHLESFQNLLLHVESGVCLGRCAGLGVLEKVDLIGDGEKTVVAVVVVARPNMKSNQVHGGEC